MKSKKKNMTKILQITKLLLTDNIKCIKYLNNEDNQIIKDQLPLIADTPTPLTLTSHQAQLCRNISVKNRKTATNKAFALNVNGTDTASLRLLLKNKRKPSFFIKKSASGLLYYKSSARLTTRMINDYLFDDSFLEDSVGLKYDEANIFHKKHFYEKVIKEEIEKIKASDPKTNDISILNRVCNKRYPRESLLTLTSVSIKYINTDTDEEFNFSLPFNLMPIFYHQLKDNHLLILLAITKFRENYRQPYVDLKEFYNLIRNNSGYASDTSGDKSSKAQNDKPVPKSSETSVGIATPITKRKTTVLPSTSHQLIDKSPIKLLLRSNANSHIHISKYLWVTPQSSFIVELSMPRIKVDFKSISLQVQKFIDSELLLFLFTKEFLHWNFYVLHYLFSFKKFRSIIDSLSSKRLDEAEWLNKTINISDARVQKYSKGDFTWKGCYTNERHENSLMRIKMISLEISNVVDKNAIALPYKVRFSYEQSYFLSKAAKRVELLDFIRKFIDVSQNRIIFDLVKFDSYTEANLLSHEAKTSAKLKPTQDKSKLDILFKQAQVVLSPLTNHCFVNDLSLERDFVFEEIEQLNSLFPFSFGSLINTVLAKETTRTLPIEFKTKTSKTIMPLTPFHKRKTVTEDNINERQLEGK